MTKALVAREALTPENRAQTTRSAGPDASAPVSQQTDLELGLSWLVKLRWGAAMGQLLALLIVRFAMGLELPYGPLLGLVAFTVLSNVGLAFFLRTKTPTWHLPAVLALDVVLLGLMLAASGGPSNPFTVFFLVHVALAALLLEPRRAWALSGLTIACFGALFVLPQEHHAHAHDHSRWSQHLVGMWVAYVLSAGFVAYFVGKVSQAIRERDRRLAQVARLAAQNERLATLSSFSANAAHELGSPLATIALAAKELAIAIERGAPPSELASDADLVCREVMRCRTILADLSARAGESVGEMPSRTTPQAIIDEVFRIASPRLTPHVRVSFDAPATAQLTLVLPAKTLAQMLYNLLRNAFDAQSEVGVDKPVELRVERGSDVCFHVLDHGPGFAKDVVARIGEPFVTTKGDGGLGLGLYLARSYATRVGGRLVLEAREGGGADVTLCVPVHGMESRP